MIAIVRILGYERLVAWAASTVVVALRPSHYNFWNTNSQGGEK